MNTKNRRLLITGGSLGLVLGMTFGGLTFADGPVLLHADVEAPDPDYEFTVANRFSSIAVSERGSVRREARQNELIIASIIIIGSAVALTLGVAAPARS